MKFKSETVNEHSFNIGGLFQHFARNLRKRISSFNPFKFLTTSTTTEAPLDFSDEDKDGDSSVSTYDGGVSSSALTSSSLEDEKETESSSEDEDNSSSSSSGNESDSSSSKGGTQNFVQSGGVLANVLKNGYAYPDPAISVKIEQAPISYVPPRSSYLPAN